MNALPLISRNKREGRYAGKCIGKHYRDNLEMKRFPFGSPERYIDSAMYPEKYKCN